jgi:hypothetical protein
MSRCLNLCHWHWHWPQPEVSQPVACLNFYYAEGLLAALQQSHGGLTVTVVRDSESRSSDSESESP